MVSSVPEANDGTFNVALDGETQASPESSSTQYQEKVKGSKLTSSASIEADALSTRDCGEIRNSAER